MEVLFDRLLVKRDSADEVTATGIIIPSAAQEKQYFGTVRETGKEVKYVNKGDRILFERYAGEDVNLNDEDLLIIREEAVIGIVSKGTK